MRMNTTVFATFSVIVLISGLFAQSPNPKIKRILDQAQLKYQVDKDGDFKMTFGLENDRSQLVYVISRTEEFAGQPIVEIWSPAYKGSEISQETLVRLAVDGHKRKIGGWQLISGSDNIYAVFKAKVPLSSLTPEFMRAVCGGVASTADEMEREVMNGSDEF